MVCPIELVLYGWTIYTQHFDPNAVRGKTRSDAKSILGHLIQSKCTTHQATHYFPLPTKKITELG